MKRAPASTSGMPMMPKAAKKSGGRTPSAASNRIQVPQSKNSKKRLLKTMPAGSQWPHSMVNCRRLMKLAIGGMIAVRRHGGQPDPKNQRRESTPRINAENQHHES